MLVQGALMRPGGTLAVEHPENGLHPTNELALGSFFAGLWLSRGVRSIIETHSDNLVLRLRRLAASGELPNQDISIAYFHQNPDTGAIQVRNIGVRENGWLEPGLPMSFFGANVTEALNLGAGTPHTG
jgi:predicted ATPase